MCYRTTKGRQALLAPLKVQHHSEEGGGAGPHPLTEALPPPPPHTHAPTPSCQTPIRFLLRPTKPRPRAHACPPDFAPPVPQTPVAGVTAEAKLFVGDLPPTITEGELSAIFSQYGPLDRIVMLKRNPRRACAFVIYAQHSAAVAAIRDLHDQNLFSGGQEAVVVCYAERGKGSGVAAAPVPVDAGAYRGRGGGVLCGT